MLGSNYLTVTAKVKVSSVDALALSLTPRRGWSADKSSYALVREDGVASRVIR